MRADDSTSQLSAAIEITTAGHVLDHNQTGSYLVFVPEANEVGTPYVTFNVSFRLVEEPTLMGEAVTVTVNVLAVNDVPTAHAFSYTLVESGGPWRDGGLWCTVDKGVTQPPTGCTREQMPIGNSIEVHLLGTDDPNEQGQPLELFITSLPSLGTVHYSPTHSPKPTQLDPSLTHSSPHLTPKSMSCTHI